MKICTQMIDTPIGKMLAGAVDEGICLLEFYDRRMLATQKERVKKYFDGELIDERHHHFSQLNDELEKYFKGEKKQFDVPLTYPGSFFQRTVWESLLTIPFGQTRTYAQQSEIIGNPKAIRAMAKANGDNRIAIIIPCHRVIGSNGEMVGYGGQIWRKKALLELEGAIPKQGELF